MKDENRNLWLVDLLSPSLWGRIIVHYKAQQVNAGLSALERYTTRHLAQCNRYKHSMFPGRQKTGESSSVHHGRSPHGRHKSMGLVTPLGGLNGSSTAAPSRADS